MFHVLRKLTELTARNLVDWRTLSKTVREAQFGKFHLQLERSHFPAKKTGIHLPDTLEVNFYELVIMDSSRKKTVIKITTRNTKGTGMPAEHDILPQLNRELHVLWMTMLHNFQTRNQKEFLLELNRSR